MQASKRGTKLPENCVADWILMLITDPTFSQSYPCLFIYLIAINYWIIIIIIHYLHLLGSFFFFWAHLFHGPDLWNSTAHYSLYNFILYKYYFNIGMKQYSQPRVVDPNEPTGISCPFVTSWIRLEKKKKLFFKNCYFQRLFIIIYGTKIRIWIV